MSDDLVKRARKYGDDPQDVSLGEWAEWSHKWADRIEELEAKLAKAVELALEECPYRDGTGPYNDWWFERRTTLEELKGDKE